MNVRNIFDNDVRADQYDRMLDKMGLQRKTAQDTTFASIGLFGLGLAVGASLGLLFAPKRGEELRSEALDKLPGRSSSQRMSGQEQQIYQSSRP